MKFKVFEISSARRDISQIFSWLFQRSRRGAIAWLSAYDKIIDDLRADARSFPEAIEATALGRPVREALFKTRRGRMYRVIFLIEGDDVYVLRVRGPGQATIQ